jgi:ligand-binding SRPBCC domain-containing protein
LVTTPHHNDPAIVWIREILRPPELAEEAVGRLLPGVAKNKSSVYDFHPTRDAPSAADRQCAGKANVDPDDLGRWPIENFMAQFETRITLPQSRESVFEFLIRTENLLQMIPPDAGMRVVSIPNVLQCGSRLEFQMTAFGQSLKIVHEITELAAPGRLVEEQIQGLFKRWVHEHLVEEDPAGHVVAVDRIDFEPPAGVLGFLVTKRKIIEQLEGLFAHRHQQMRKVLG